MLCCHAKCHRLATWCEPHAFCSLLALTGTVSVSMPAACYQWQLSDVSRCICRTHEFVFVGDRQTGLCRSHSQCSYWEQLAAVTILIQTIMSATFVVAIVVVSIHALLRPHNSARDACRCSMVGVQACWPKGHSVRHTEVNTTYCSCAARGLVVADRWWAYDC